MPLKKGNQHKPCPPLDVIGPAIKTYFDMGMSDIEILQHLHDRHIDQSQYGLGIRTLKKMRDDLGLQSTRQQGHNLTSAAPFLLRVRARYPKAGLRDMIMQTFREEGIKVSRKVVEQFFRTHEPEGIQECKARRLKRKHFWAAGVSDLWVIDQHDKFKHFNLWLHTGVKPYSGVILWLKVWWTNKNPCLILHYYLDAIAEVGGIPLVTQSDPGSENYGVANGHTTLRHMFDPSLEGTRQHRWMRKHNNVKPEIAWSQLRRRFTPGFEDMLEHGVQAGWYDPSDPLDMLLFRWLFIPWLQAELDSWRLSHNRTPKRADKNKILPHGRPQIIFEAPHLFDSLDFKVCVTPEAIKEVREHYAPSDDPVFQLVPSAFDQLAERIYIDAGSPEIERETIWGIYTQMLVTIRHVYSDAPAEDLQAAARLTLAANEDEGPLTIALTEGLRELRNGDAIVGPDGFYYMGGINEGYVLPDETGQRLYTGGGFVQGSTGLARTQDDYPASFDLEDHHAGLEANETAMVCANFSDDETDIPVKEW